MNGARFGPQLTADGVTFRLWAPAAKRVDLLLDGAHAMHLQDDGWFDIHISGAGPGATYKFRINGEVDVPDPASAFQPSDVSGPSEVIDHGVFNWRANDWRGRAWEETVLIETHVGAFTPEGTYQAMIGKLDHLVATGFTALELMPLADFPGRRNWGYDGVLWFAPDHGYGRPDDLKSLIDQAHLRGLMVFLDVVYNHFGPQGNYLGRYAPSFFTDAQTPWGSAINYHVPQVRAFVFENALAWLRDYRFDGLRLDAVHAIAAPGEPSLLYDLSCRVQEFARQTNRHIHLVLENDDNSASLLDARPAPSPGKYRAQWNDDYHHAWHVLLSGETGGYYADYADHPRRQIARILGSGFAYQGEPSRHRDGQMRGEPSGELTTTAFVNFLQNHDQIGNRALGDRLESTASKAAIEAALAITLLAPMPPMLFMGEEWGSTTPFPFFCDFDGDLAEAIHQGRRREFSAAYEKLGDDVPDPLSETTFRSALLDWNSLSAGAARERLELVTRLLTIRAREIIPRLENVRFGRANAREDGLLYASWHLGEREVLHLEANLSDQAIASSIPDAKGDRIWGGEIPHRLAPWSVFWMVGER